MVPSLIGFMIKMIERLQSGREQPFDYRSHQSPLWVYSVEKLQFMGTLESSVRCFKNRAGKGRL